MLLGSGGAECEGSLTLALSPTPYPQSVSSSPLIEPDVRISRIRLSDRFHASVFGSDGRPSSPPDSFRGESTIPRAGLPPAGGDAPSRRT